ncbi:MAG: HAD-IIIA family hydrolase [Alphaproteobacteria bacterium]|nr:HAD-IIIA family hydrolase [Alphaproteobacteria bacterium]
MPMLILLDRDGVLNEDRNPGVTSPGELVLLPGAPEAVARLNAAGHKVALITNQSVVGRGIIPPAMLETIHGHLREGLAAKGAHLDLILACTDPPWAATERRKPRPGMLREAMQHFRERPENAIMVGDALRDMEAAAEAGCRRILVRTGKGRATQASGLPAHVMPVAVYENLSEAADAIVNGRVT